MAAIDYYKILGLERTAKAADIKKAYRALARKYHPDTNSGDKEANKKFQQLNEANSILGDPEKKKKYDLYGENWEHGAEQQEQQRQYSSGGNAAGFGGGNYDDIFSSMFGNSGRRGGQMDYRGQDYNSEVQLSLKEAFTTHQRTFTVNGKNIRITVPAGVENGQTIKIKGNGAPGSNGASNGDLYITFIIPDSPPFKRKGNDLYTTIIIDLYTALLGGEMVIDSINEKIKIKIPPETQNGMKLRLKGKGFPKYKSAGVFGDLYVTYDIKIPTKLTDQQKELVRQLASLQQ